LVVRSVLKQKPHLRKCLKQCRHCRILFFTHPRNAGRSDLGCPFGCRKAHRRKNAIDRSTEYYRTKEGKEKKKHFNAARSQQNRLSEPSRDKNENDDRGTEVDGATVLHIQLVTSLVEGRWVGMAEIFAMLDKILRQHSIDSVVKLPYAGLCHQENPP
jgi:hypothetical protein